MSEIVTAMEWLGSHDTGISSEAIMRRMLGTIPEASSYPFDPSDLGRCIRLLDRIPAWRPRMPEMADAGRVWAVIANRWVELEALYHEEFPTGDFPRTYDLLESLRSVA